MPLGHSHSLLQSKWDVQCMPIIPDAGEAEAGVWLDSS